MVPETMPSTLSAAAPTELKDLLSTASFVGMAAELYTNDAATRSAVNLIVSASGLKTIRHVKGRMGPAKLVIENERTGLYGYSKRYIKDVIHRTFTSKCLNEYPTIRLIK